ncbi:MAG: co-chaperone GroES [Planctomycetota bacterium]|jgi:chaperonin GroES
MAKKAKTPKLRPLDDRVVVKRLEAEEKTAGGIILPDAAKEKPMQAEVVAVGEGKLFDNGKRVAPDVKVGDIILLGKYAGSEVKVDDEDLVILRESDILAKLA